MLFRRLELFLAGKSPAVALFSGPYYFAEQLGFRKVIDNTFMIATMINGNPVPDDIRKFFRALRRAQRDIDLRPELYTHYYKNEFPERFHAKMDTRCWGPGERIVFEPYGKEMFSSHSTGSPRTQSSSPEAWAPASTNMRSSRLPQNNALAAKEDFKRTESRGLLDTPPRLSDHPAKPCEARRWISAGGFAVLGSANTRRSSETTRSTRTCCRG